MFLQNEFSLLANLIKEQKVKVINNSIRYLFVEKELLKKLIKAHLKYKKNIKKEKKVQLRKQRDKIRDELEEKMAEVEIILEICEKLIYYENIKLLITTKLISDERLVIQQITYIIQNINGSWLINNAGLNHQIHEF